MAKLSIIIPVYNAEKWIYSSIQSALKSYSGELEVICVDDGSTDSTPELIESASRIDSRVKCIHQSNQGRCSARNRGIECASGDYITFLDADDQMISSAMDKCVSAMRSDVALVCTIGRFRGSQEIVCTDKGASQVGEKEIGMQSEDALSFLLNSDYEAKHNNEVGLAREVLSLFSSFWCSTVFTKLFSAEQIKSRNVRFQPGLRFGEDVIFLYDYLVGQGSKVIFLPVETHEYNTSNAGTIRQYRRGDASALNRTIKAWHGRFLDSRYKRQISVCVTRNVLFLATRAFAYCSPKVALDELDDILTNDILSEILRCLDIKRLDFSKSRLDTTWINAAKDLATAKKKRLLIRLYFLGLAQRLKRT